MINGLYKFHKKWIWIHSILMLLCLVIGIYDIITKAYVGLILMVFGIIIQIMPLKESIKFVKQNLDGKEKKE